MAGRRSKKTLEEMAMKSLDETIESASDAAAEAELLAASEEPAAPAPVSEPPVSLKPAASREAELEDEVAKLKAINEALKATASEKPVIEGWPESVVPRQFDANYSGDFFVNPTGARGVMVLEGTLYVCSPGGSSMSRVLPGGYAMIAKGQPHGFETGPSPVRAVFVESSEYGSTLEAYNPDNQVAAVPSATAPSQVWASAPASVQTTAVNELAPPPPSAPVPVVVQSKAVTQLLEMQRHRGKRGFEVRHPNDRVPVPPAPTANQKAGRHPSGAPLPVADGAPAVSTGEGVVR